MSDSKTKVFQPSDKVTVRSGKTARAASKGLTSENMRKNRIPIMMSNEEIAQIDDWRFFNRIATRADAVRKLCSLALAMGPSSNVGPNGQL